MGVLEPGYGEAAASAVTAGEAEEGEEGGEEGEGERGGEQAARRVGASGRPELPLAADIKHRADRMALTLTIYSSQVENLK